MKLEYFTIKLLKCLFKNNVIVEKNFPRNEIRNTGANNWTRVGIASDPTIEISIQRVTNKGIHKTRQVSLWRFPTSLMKREQITSLRMWLGSWRHFYALFYFCSNELAKFEIFFELRQKVCAHFPDSHIKNQWQ